MRLPPLLACAAIALGACGHEQPFGPVATGSSLPFLPGLPARLTYNPGTDLHAAWLRDGSAFLYAFQQSGVPVIDRCISEMPATGGSTTRTICNPDPASADSADLFDWPAPSAAGRLLYVRSSSPPGALAPRESGVYLGSLADPLAAARILSLPYTVPGGQTHGGISNIHWVNEHRLIYLGMEVIYGAMCSGCPQDTLVRGLELVDLDVTGSQPVLSVIPGSTGATSAALSTDGGTLYYTLQNDSVVYRRDLTTGQVDVAHDFGARGVARDITVLGSRLVAVVGGKVQPPGGPDVPDAGPLVSVDLATGTESVLPSDQSVLFRRPQFAPTGTPVRLVAEGYAFSVGPPPVFDTTLTKRADLYLFTSP